MAGSRNGGQQSNEIEVYGTASAPLPTKATVTNPPPVGLHMHTSVHRKRMRSTGASECVGKAEDNSTSPATSATRRKQHRVVATHLQLVLVPLAFCCRRRPARLLNRCFGLGSWRRHARLQKRLASHNFAGDTHAAARKQLAVAAEVPRRHEATAYRFSQWPTATVVSSQRIAECSAARRRFDQVAPHQRRSARNCGGGGGSGSICCQHHMRVQPPKPVRIGRPALPCDTHSLSVARNVERMLDPGCFDDVRQQLAQRSAG